MGLLSLLQFKGGPRYSIHGFDYLRTLTQGKTTDNRENNREIRLKCGFWNLKNKTTEERNLCKYWGMPKMATH